MFEIRYFYDFAMFTINVLGKVTTITESIEPEKELEKSMETGAEGKEVFEKIKEVKVVARHVNMEIEDIEYV